MESAGVEGVWAVRYFLDAVLDGLTVMVTTAAPILAIVGLYKLLELVV